MIQPVSRNPDDAVLAQADQGNKFRSVSLSFMPSSLEEQLARAKDLIGEGERRIGRQLELVAELERLGADTVLARQLLAKLEDVLRIQVTNRDDLLVRWHLSHRGGPDVQG